MARIGWRRAGAVLLAVSALASMAACDSGGDGNPPDDPPADEALVYVALGDSFSAGEGAPPYDQGSGKCLGSALSWPRRLDKDSTDILSVDHRACAGAKTEHLTGPWSSRGLGPQIPTEPDPDVDLVTLTVGGNDLGFGDIVASCVLFRCSPAPGSDDLGARLSAVEDALVDSVYPRLQDAYPNARIAHVGYPRLTPAPGESSGDCFWLSDGDQEVAAGIVAELDEAIERATESTGGAVEYVDVTGAFTGHELCTDDAWVNPVGIGAGYAHPNAKGQRSLELVVAEALGIGI